VAPVGKKPVSSNLLKRQTSAAGGCKATAAFQQPASFH
jgi:hypothetical protein